MLDQFSGRPTFLHGDALPGADEQAAISDDHQRRLAALDRLGAAASERGFGDRSRTDFNFYAAPKVAVSLIAQSGEYWAPLAQALRALREYLPLLPLAVFGFQDQGEEPFSEENFRNPYLRHIGGGVEAWAFQDAEGSIYKFFRPREAWQIGATFRFTPGAERLLQAESCLGTYRNLLEKLHILNFIGGMPTEITGITPEGILVAKQAFGRRLPEGTDTSKLLPPALIPIPSIFLRCDRDHPRLAFIHDGPWLVADFHDRNLVYDLNGAPRIIDLVAAPFPAELIANSPLLRDWLERVRHDPAAGMLDDAPDDEL